MKKNCLYIYLLILLPLGCATKEPEFPTTSSIPSLEVPPDLSQISGGEVLSADKADSTRFSEINKQQRQPIVNTRQKVLPNYATIAMERAGSQRWLVVQAEAEALWFELRAFILKKGFVIAKQNPETGIMVTEWREHRPLVAGKTKNKLSEILGSLYSTGRRDKFRVRLERGNQAGQMEVYVSHQAMEEVVANGSNADIIQTVWQPRPTDVELETEFLQLFLVYMGESNQHAKAVLAAPVTQQHRASLNQDNQGQSELIINNDYEISWRRLGLSLDRIGFTVEDRDKTKGLYVVRYIDPEGEHNKPGFFSRLFGNDKKQASKYYLLKLSQREANTAVDVVDKQGQKMNTETAKRILSLLYEQLK